MRLFDRYRLNRSGVILPSSSSGRRPPCQVALPALVAPRRPSCRPHGLQRPIDLPAVRDVRRAPSPAPTTGPVSLYTLEKPEHRNPVPIIWHADSSTFFVAAWIDGTIYRGRLDDPSVRVFLEGQPDQAATGIGISGERLLVASGCTATPRLRPADQAADRRVHHRLADSCTACMSPTPGDVWMTDAVRPVL